MESPVHEDEPVEAIREAADLTALASVFGTDSVHQAYFRAKAIWTNAIAEQQATTPAPTGLPGRCVTVEGTDFHVHGVTHAGTHEEERFLRRHVADYLERGGTVYCEQGIRRMYFDDMEEVCEMDDYRWAMAKCDELEGESRLDRFAEGGLLEDVGDIAAEFRAATFAIIESGGSIYGDRFEQALGDVAAGFLTDHADIAVGKDYEAFSLSREASRDPERLVDLQRYYERTFLPQPLEREWLRRHDPELEIVSHARNERMAEYVVYHNESADEVHLIVGAAHQPGVRYYLERLRDGEELSKPFELF